MLLDIRFFFFHFLNFHHFTEALFVSDTDFSYPFKYVLKSLLWFPAYNAVFTRLKNKTVD